MELTTLFLYRFLSIGIGNRYQSSIVIGLSIDYAWSVVREANKVGTTDGESATSRKATELGLLKIITAAYKLGLIHLRKGF